MYATRGVSLLLVLLLGFCTAYPLDDHEKSAAESEDIGTTIIRMNNGSNEMLLEGDLLIPRTRTAMKCTNEKYSCRWPKSSNGKVEIPFIISEQYDNSEKSMILSAMKGFEPRTCIRFIPRQNENVYLSIEPKYGKKMDIGFEMPLPSEMIICSSCFSMLGRIGDKQVVSLQRFGCVDYGIIQHELMHALGFYHEHTRSDRDQYVRINWENIIEYYLQNFKKMDTDNLGTSYDYSSIMQYGRTAFGKLGKETITPIPDASVPIGQRKGLSNIDILRVNKLYNC